MWKSIIAALLGAALAVAGLTAVGAGAGPPVIHFRPTHDLVVDGYGYSCQTTARTPNFACWYGPPNGPTSTPIMTVSHGSRTMVVDSARAPRVERVQGVGFETTFTR
jgi:hypothetical protein